MGRVITTGATRSRRCALAALAVMACLALAGCGGTANPRPVGLGNVPLPSGTRVMTHLLSCDHGVNPYCSVQLVVVGDHYQTSTDLLTAEQDRLAKLGWTATQGPDGNEQSADSPGHGLRLNYATAYDDLLGVDSNWIQRRRPVAHALATALFDRAPAISLMLLRGSS
jgi:hypothetical protein